MLINITYRVSYRDLQLLKTCQRLELSERKVLSVYFSWAISKLGLVVVVLLEKTEVTLDQWVASLWPAEYCHVIRCYVPSLSDKSCTRASNSLWFRHIASTMVVSNLYVVGKGGPDM